VPARGPYPLWAKQADLEDHFRDHGHEFGAINLTEYDHSARETIRMGRRFEFVNKAGFPRVGYYVMQANALTTLSHDERTIVSHFRPTAGAAYVRRLNASTYR
jgi:pyocin large subunit-like protein